MTRLLFITLALVMLVPTVAFGRPASDYETVAFITKDQVQAGLTIRVVAREFGDLASCGETYTTVFRGEIANEFGESPRMIRFWGHNLLNGIYKVEKLWKGDGESDCAVLVRVATPK